MGRAATERVNVDGRMGSLGSELGTWDLARDLGLGLSLLVCCWCRCQSNKTGRNQQNQTAGGLRRHTHHTHIPAVVGQQYNLNRNEK